MEIKQFWQSKTLWTQLLAVLSLLIPGVNEWVSTNPVAATSVFAAINTIVRFATHGKISPFPVSGSTNLLMVVGMTSVAFGLVFSQTSCTAASATSLGGVNARFHFVDPDSGAKGGLSFTDGQLIPFVKVPITDDEGNVIGEFELITPPEEVVVDQDGKNGE